MSPLELKRIKLELIKVSAARHELEFKIEERLDEIARIKEHIKVQEAKEAELQQKIDAGSAAS
jgi:hypothetical protein